MASPFGGRVGWRLALLLLPPLPLSQRASQQLGALAVLLGVVSGFAHQPPPAGAKHRLGAPLQDLRLAGRDAMERLRGTSDRNRALVAPQAAIVLDLQVQRSVHQGAADDALATADAQRRVDRVLVETLARFLLDEPAFDRSGRAHLVLGRRVQGQIVHLEIARADVAESAHVETVDALDRRYVQHAVGSAIAAAGALVGVQLPDHRLVFRAASRQKSPGAGQCDHTGRAQSVVQEPAAILFWGCLRHHILLVSSCRLITARGRSQRCSRPHC